MERLTQDHSMVADIIRQGTLTEEEARVHPQRSVITRALGSDPNMAPDTFDVEASPGDELPPVRARADDPVPRRDLAEPLRVAPAQHRHLHVAAGA